MSTTLTVHDAHNQAVRASLREMTRLLSQLLSRRLTAYIAGVGDTRTVTRWVNGETTTIRDRDVEQRLRTAYEIASLLLSADSSDVVRAWFISLNPQLDDVTPVQAIHEQQLKEALAAARAFVAGG